MLSSVTAEHRWELSEPTAAGSVKPKKVETLPREKGKKLVDISFSKQFTVRKTIEGHSFGSRTWNAILAAVVGPPTFDRVCIHACRSSRYSFRELTQKTYTYTSHWGFPWSTISGRVVFPDLEETGGLVGFFTVH